MVGIGGGRRWELMTRVSSLLRFAHVFLRVGSDSVRRWVGFIHLGLALFVNQVLVLYGPLYFSGLGPVGPCPF